MLARICLSSKVSISRSGSACMKISKRSLCVSHNILIIKNPHEKNKISRKMSRYSANTIMSKHDTFSFDDYDCIGFDLDNTLCHYNVRNMVRLEYDILSKFLVEKKGYDSKFLYEPFEKDLDYLQKGLILDLKRGNTLKLDSNSAVFRASHGRRMLSEKEVIDIYGPNKIWNVAASFTQDMLEAWNGPKSLEIRALLDYFDMPASLCFARAVETVDRQSKTPVNEYKVWPDILDGLVYMFTREHFALDQGEYFPTFKKEPECFYRPCGPKVVDWLRQLRDAGKITFLITGSNVDYANLTATQCIGPHWQELFDVIIYYSRKPGLFVGNRPFYTTTSDLTEGNLLKPGGLKLCSATGYSQGNWVELKKLFVDHFKKDDVRTLYVGDNLLQDVYTPSVAGHCDTVAIVEELAAEGVVGQTLTDPDADILTSNRWGSYFRLKDSKNVEIPTMWCDAIRHHSKICIPGLEAISSLPVDHQFLTFSDNKFCTAGFYPGAPISAVNDG